MHQMQPKIISSPLSGQIQNLAGKELVFPRIKEADWVPQRKAIEKRVAALGSGQPLTVLDLGAGEGLNAPLFNNVAHACPVHIVAVEPFKEFHGSYKEAYQQTPVKVCGIEDATLTSFNPESVRDSFPGGTRLIFASHSLYYAMDDIFAASKASKALKTNPSAVTTHPLYKYFQMLGSGDMFLITLSSAPGIRVTMNMVLGDTKSATLETKSDGAAAPAILKNFKNADFFMRHFSVFQQAYQTITRRQLNVETHLSVASVPMGNYEVAEDSASGRLSLHNPDGSDTDPHWITPRVFEFYASWSKASRREQDTFLNLLNVFAVNGAMRHTNSTIAITVQ